MIVTRSAVCPRDECTIEKNQSVCRRSICVCGGDPAEIRALYRALVENSRRVAENKIGVSRDETVTEVLPGRFIDQQCVLVTEHANVIENGPIGARTQRQGRRYIFIWRRILERQISRHEGRGAASNFNDLTVILRRKGPGKSNRGCLWGIASPDKADIRFVHRDDLVIDTGRDEDVGAVEFALASDCVDGLLHGGEGLLVVWNDVIIGSAGSAAGISGRG